MSIFDLFPRYLTQDKNFGNIFFAQTYDLLLLNGQEVEIPHAACDMLVRARVQSPRNPVNKGKSKLPKMYSPCLTSFPTCNFPSHFDKGNCILAPLI